MKTHYFLGGLLLLLAAAAGAANVGLAGIFPGKALLTINGGPPRTVAVGAMIEGVKVISINEDSATLEVDGVKRVMRVGQNVAVQHSASSGQNALLTADSRGHFITTGSINGGSVRFLVDTGASLISIGASDARRLALDTLNGRKGFSQTANGTSSVTHIKLDTVRVGEITLHGVDGLVHESDMPYVLLGMSFLNRMEMSRSGDTMTLKKRF